MTQTLTPRQLQALAARLGADAPVMAWRITGRRVELHLLGGAVAEGDLAELLPNEIAGDDRPRPANYAFMTVRQLRDLAAGRGLRNLGGLRKRDLVRALKKLDQEEAPYEEAGHELP
jgi:hypothetical protein